MWQRPARLALWGSISGLRGRAPKKDRADRDGSSLRHGRTKESPASLEGTDGASEDSIVETSAVRAPSTRDLRLGSEVRR